MSKPRASIDSIQALRGIAALLVMLFHVNSGINDWFAPQKPLPHLIVGASGVDIFFVLSGFIIVLTSTNADASTFMRKRLARLVPIYWLSIFVFYVSSAIVPAKEGQDNSISALLHSLLFIPYERPDGSLQPLNPVGWSLNYEMLFYLLFALGLALVRRPSVFVGVALVAAVAWGSWSQPAQAALRFWTAPIVLEFLAGMAIAHLYLSGYRLTATAASALAALGAVILFSSAAAFEPVGWWRVLIWGGPAFLIVAAAALAPGFKAPAALVHLGNISFSLYLLHLPVLLAFKHLGGRLGLPWSYSLTAWAAAGALVGVSVVVSTVSFALIERPFTQLGRGRAAPRPGRE